MTIFGVIGACVLGAIYSYATCYIPFIYLNFILTFLYGVMLGVFVGGGAKKGKVRNLKFCGAYGFIMGLFGVYTAWVVWIYAYSKGQVLIISPESVYNTISNLAEHGVWQLKGSTPKGVFLWIIWGIEAAIIAFVSMFMASGMIATEAFCEECGVWASDLTEIAPVEYLGDPTSCKSDLEQQNFSSLENRKLVPAESATYSKVTLINCPSCKDFHLLSLANVVVTLDKDGNPSKSENNFVENMFITSEVYSTLKETVGKEMLQETSANEAVSKENEEDSTTT